MTKKNWISVVFLNENSTEIKFLLCNLHVQSNLEQRVFFVDVFRIHRMLKPFICFDLNIKLLNSSREGNFNFRVVK